MAVIIDNPNTVEAPAPGQLRYGIFRTATVTDDLDSRGISAGFTFPAEDCGTSYLYDAMCAPGDAEEKIFDEGTPYMEALRSEERRVGKEYRTRRPPQHYRKKQLHSDRGELTDAIV